VPELLGLSHDEAKLLLMNILLTSDPAKMQGNVDVVNKGDQIILPEGMSVPHAMEWLKRKEKADNEMISYNEAIAGFPLDVVRALGLVVKEKFGFSSTADFWPSSYSIEVDADGSTDQVFVGAFSIPAIEDSQISTAPTGPLELTISFKVKQKDKERVKEIAALTRKKLQSDSVYRGKAFQLTWGRNPTAGQYGWETPKFIKTGLFGTLQVNDDTQRMIDVIWTLIERTAQARRLKIPLKKGFMLEGPYGVGKSLFATETASLAEKHGWTYIYLKDPNTIPEAYRFAKQYQPAILFAEDIDTIVSMGSNGDWELPETVRNAIDGVDTKENEVLLMLTSNFPEKTPKSLLRPGRLDGVVPFRPPNSATVERLIRQYAGELLAPTENLTLIARILESRIASVVREVVERAKVMMLTRRMREDPSDVLENPMITADDLQLAAISMEHQLKLMDAEPTTSPSWAMQFGHGFGELVGRHVAEAVYKIGSGSDTYYDDDETAEEIAAPAAAI
jgi:transitional endoplasmic reticulum ATPase